MQTLFGQLDPERGGHADGPFASVALENALDKELDYAIPPRLREELRVGQRVRVPLGRKNRSTFGYVVGIKPDTDYPRIKSVLEIQDHRVLIHPRLMELARWISRYYVAPLGTVLDAVIPSAVKKKVGLATVQLVRLVQPKARVQEVFETMRARKQRAVLARMLLIPDGESIELNKLAESAGTRAATVRQTAKSGLIEIRREMDFEPSARQDPPNATECESAEFSAPSGAGSIHSLVERAKDAAPVLSEEQSRVMDELAPRMREGGFGVNLLFGVTGSGKTEIYLRCLSEVVRAGKQAIVLVPEIALTPQTVRRFTQRFKRVAVLHSGLTAGDRHRYWRQIASGQADVVVGARSAIFAPLPNLGLVVVDEEHESSYKQDSVPRYQARDVAIKRAQLESAPVILGSATPSLEMYARAREATNDPSVPYHLLRLPHRVRGLQMPAVELVDLKQEARLRPGVHLLSQRLEHLLGTTIQAGHQAILLLNRRGYSNFVYCASCQEALGCKYCDTTLTFHRMANADVHSASSDQAVHTGQLHCHYCLAVQPLPDKCPSCGKKLSLFGLGTQRVEQELARKFPELTFARVDSDTMRSGRDYEAILGRFSEGKIQVLLGTQMIAKGLDYPNVTLVGVISGDTALSLPDFRASERTFQLITQVAGRAGRGDSAGRVVLQTFMPDDPTIRAALRQDFEGFASSELVHRREVGLPPYARMVRIVIRDQDVQKLQQVSEKIATAIHEAVNAFNAQAGAASQVRVRGPMPCAIGRIAGYHRYQIVLVAQQGGALQRVLAALRHEREFSRVERVAVDVDPVSLL